MNLQIAQLFLANASQSSLSTDNGSVRSENLAQLYSANLQRLPNALIQVSSPTLPVDNFVITDSKTADLRQATVAKTAEQRLSLFDLLPVKHSAVITQADTQRLINTLAEGIAQSTVSLSRHTNAISLGGVVEQLSSNTLTLKLQLPGAPTLQLTLPKQDIQQYVPGDKIAITVKPPSELQSKADQGQWQITLQVKTPNSAVPKANNVELLAPSSSPVVKLAVAKSLAAEGLMIEGKLTAQMTSAAQLPKSLDAGKTNNLTTLLMTMRGNQLDVRGTQIKPVANISLPETSLSALPLALKPITELALQKGLPQIQGQFISPDAEGLVAKGSIVSKGTGTAPPSGDTNAMDVKQANFGSPLVQDKIRQLSRQLLAETGSTATALTKLVQILKQQTVQMSPETKALSQHLLGHLNGLSSASKPAASVGDSQLSPSATSESSTPAPNSAGLIKHLLQSPALVTTPTALLTPANQSSFINALVTLLQVGLAGRAVRAQPDLNKILDKAESITSKTLAATGTTGQTARIASDVAQLDSRTNLLEHVKALLANHQQQKIQSVESRIQGQDTLYYVLPVAQDDQAPPELLFRVEEREATAGDKREGKQKVWHLTMKLDAGLYGELLAKTKINDESIQLHIYTSTEALLTRVYDTLPHLLRRLEGLGLTVDTHSCQRGKIPPSLKDAPYQLFEAMV